MARAIHAHPAVHALAGAILNRPAQNFYIGTIILFERLQAFLILPDQLEDAGVAGYIRWELDLFRLNGRLLTSTREIALILASLRGRFVYRPEDVVLLVIRPVGQFEYTHPIRHLLLHLPLNLRQPLNIGVEMDAASVGITTRRHEMVDVLLLVWNVLYIIILSVLLRRREALHGRQHF